MSTATRLALDHPGTVTRILAAWPVTCGDPRHDPAFTTHLTGNGATDTTITALLAGDTLRGTTDTELTRLAGTVTAAIDAPHRPHTACALRRLTGAAPLGRFPEPPHPGFAADLDRFTATVAAWALNPGTSTATHDADCPH